MDAFDKYLKYQKEIAQSKLQIIDRWQKGGELKQIKRTSKINIAYNVLKGAGKPLHVTDIIRLAKETYGVQLDRDSIVSAMLKKASADQMFIRTAPNTFALASYVSR